MYDYIRCESPLGTLTLAAEGEALTAVVLDGQRYAQRHLAGDGRERETPVLCAAKLWLERYFAGRRPEPAELAMTPKGTAFQQKVWQELLKIPYGETVTYGAIAKKIGGSAQAVGGAVGRNPLTIIIPCHRVIAADGSLTGYAGGLENKRKLLELESMEGAQ